jgi:hypothetical protein
MAAHPHLSISVRSDTYPSIEVPRICGHYFECDVPYFVSPHRERVWLTPAIELNAAENGSALSIFPGRAQLKQHFAIAMRSTLRQTVRIIRPKSGI